MPILLFGLCCAFTYLGTVKFIGSEAKADEGVEWPVLIFIEVAAVTDSVNNLCFIGGCLLLDTLQFLLDLPPLVDIDEKKVITIAGESVFLLTITTTYAQNPAALNGIAVYQLGHGLLTAVTALGLTLERFKEQRFAYFIEANGLLVHFGQFSITPLKLAFRHAPGSGPWCD